MFKYLSHVARLCLSHYCVFCFLSQFMAPIYCLKLAPTYNTLSSAVSSVYCGLLLSIVSVFDLCNPVLNAISAIQLFVISDRINKLLLLVIIIVVTIILVSNETSVSSSSVCLVSNW